MNHNKDANNKSDFSLFLQQGKAQTDAPTPPSRVVRDLVHSEQKLAFVYVGGSILGYLATLVICAQCSIGLTPLAWQTAALMQNLHETACAVLCGVIFGIGPFLASSFTLSRFEHRYLLFKMTWLVCIVPVLASVVMTFVGTPHSWTWHGLWVSTAIFTPYFLECLAFLTLRQNSWRGIVKTNKT